MIDNVQVRDMREMFAWQSQGALRVLYEKYEGVEARNLVALYVALTLKASQRLENMIHTSTKDIVDYTHLSKDWVPSGLTILEKEKLIKCMDVRSDNGRFAGKVIMLQSAPTLPRPKRTDTGFLGAGPIINIDQESYDSFSKKEESKDSIKRPPVKPSGSRGKKHGVDRMVWEEVKDIILYASDNGIFNSMLPEDNEDDGPVYVTKTMLNVIQDIYRMREGVFLETYGLESSKLKADNYRSNIIEALDTYKIMQTDLSVWPADKSKLPKSFSGWIVNPMSGKSFFLNCLERGATATNTVMASRQFDETVTDEMTDMFLDWWKMYFYKINPAQILDLKGKIFLLLKDHKNIWDSYGKYYAKLGNWTAYFGGSNPTLFVKRYAEYLMEFSGEPHVGKVSPDSKSYQSFKTWMANEHKFNVNMNEDQRKALIARAEYKEAPISAKVTGTLRDVESMIDMGSGIKRGGMK